MKRKIFILALSALLLTGCSSIEQNYNKFISDVDTTQKKGRQELELDDYSSDMFNEINYTQVYNMPDNNYLVFYTSQTQTERELEFIRKLEIYKQDQDSFNVYNTHTPHEDLTRVEFIKRRGDKFYLEDVWVEPTEMDKLPYKKSISK